MGADICRSGGAGSAFACIGAAEPDTSQQQTAVHVDPVGIDVQAADALAGTSDAAASTPMASQKWRRFRRVINTVRSRLGSRRCLVITSNMKC